MISSHSLFPEPRREAIVGYLIDYLIFWTPAAGLWWWSTRVEEDTLKHKLLEGAATVLLAIPIVVHVVMRALVNAGVL